ncbi:DnaJ C-terminal domain-containing protein [Roseomonas sp. BN140053]|uniref:DnaJ C-terminal domain-containing protein n=1 Tax=Roseomonas sp. BN140053 TaxID=3391898 RepID=UPI0039ECAADB
MANDDPYQTLGVSRTASAEEIRKAYRALAKKNHPDLNPGDAAAEERFKAASTAHDLLSDPEKRARFDRGEIDASGQERPERNFYRDFAEGSQGRAYRRGGGWAGGTAGGPMGDLDPEELDELFGGFFRQGGGGAGGGTRPRRGRDAQYRLEVPFLDAVNGATQRLTLPGGQSLDVRIPPGLEDGQVLRLRGKGGPGANGGPEGDALIEVAVAPHPFFRRDGRNLLLDVPVTLAEAVLGAKVTVPTPRGEVALNVPRGADAGTQLRLRGRGVAEGGGQPAGDLFVTLTLVRGPVDPALEEFLRDWVPKHPADPRRDLWKNGGEG